MFNKIDLLLIEVYDAEAKTKNNVKDKKQFNILIKEIKKIEVKFNLLLKDQGLNSNNFNNINLLKDLNKMMYFFKMFISSTGRKNKDKIAIVDSQYDEFGNMQLFPEVEIEDDTLAQMITDFYILKDNCAYIQIANTVLQFDKDFNLLQIPKLPIFKDILTKFKIKLLVDDNLTRISLHISAIEMNEKLLKKFNNVSFKKNDANWIKTKLGNIKIVV